MKAKRSKYALVCICILGSAGAAGFDPMGTYEGQGDGAITLELGRVERNEQLLQVHLTTAAPGCYGEIKGVGQWSSAVLEVTPTPREAGDNKCAIDVTFDGKGNAETSEHNCAVYHGAACRFTGTLRRTNSDQSARGAISSLPGQPIAAHVGTIGSKTSVANLLNPAIADLRASKEVDSSKLHVAFSFKNPKCPSCKFLVRLFDKNGTYLTHLITQTNLQLLGEQGIFDIRERELTLTLQVSARDLRDAAIIELGFYVAE